MAEAANIPKTQEYDMGDEYEHSNTDLVKSNSRANITLTGLVKGKEGQITPEGIVKITEQSAILEGEEESQAVAPQKQYIASINVGIDKIATKIAELPKWQQYETNSAIDMAQRRAQRLTEYAANLNRYRETISTAAVDIATHVPTTSLTGENLQTVLERVTKATDTINKHPLLKKSKSITKLLLNIVELHKTENTPTEIQENCRELGNLIIEHPNFTIDEKAQLTTFVLMLRDTIALMSEETLPVLREYVQGVQESKAFKDHSQLEQQVINALRPAFRCCSAFTNWITKIPERIADAQTFKWTKKLVEWGFNPGTVATIGSWLNQESVINSVKESGKLPEVYPTEYLLFKIAFLSSVALFGSTVYFYYVDKVRRDTTSRRASVPVASASSPTTLSRLQTTEQSDLLSDDPIRQDQYVFDIYTFLQNFKKDYFPDIEQKEGEDAVRASLPNLTEEVLGGNPDQQKEQFNKELTDTITTEEEEAKNSIQEVPEFSEKDRRTMSRTISSSIMAKQPQPVIRNRTQYTSAVLENQVEQTLEERKPKTQRTGSVLDATGSSAFRRIRKSKRKSLRKSKRKSLRKSKRKSVRKSLRKPIKKSVRKSKRNSVRKSLRKPVKKSVRKSLRKPVKKSVRKSVRKSLRKSKRKSLRKPVRKSLKKSPRKSTRKNKVMKKSR